VEQLFLTGNQIGAEGAKALAESTHRGSLRVLSLDGQALGDEGAKALAGFDGLESLSLNNAQITGVGASALLSQVEAETLLLRENPLNRGELAFGRFSEGIQFLDLRSSFLGADQIRALGAAELGGGVKRIRLDSNPLGDEGIRALGAVPWLTDLNKLTVEKSGASVEERKALRKTWGKRGGLKVEPR
jgi:hypothetical protein